MLMFFLAMVHPMALPLVKEIFSTASIIDSAHRAVILGSMLIQDIRGSAMTLPCQYRHLRLQNIY